MGTRGRFGRTATLAVVLLMVIVGLSGCTADDSAPSPSAHGMWRDAIDRALSDPELSDFERGVLSDYQISDEEYQEARNRYKECLTDLGWVMTDGPGGTVIGGAPGTVNEGKAITPEVLIGCTIGTTQYIEPLYIDMRDNPEGVTRAQQIRECFEKNEVPDGSDLSDEEFTQMVFDPDYHASTPEGKLCYQDPTGSLGYTVELAVEMDARRNENQGGEEIPQFPLPGGGVGEGAINENPDYTGPK